MQLYEKKKDGNSVSSSTVVLMVTAVCYAGVSLYRYISADFQGEMLRQYLGGYFGLYLLGSVFESGDHARRDWNDCPAAMDNCLGGYF